MNKENNDRRQFLDCLFFLAKHSKIENFPLFEERKAEKKLFTNFYNQI